jgi:hypothetical protein
MLCCELLTIFLIEIFNNLFMIYVGHLSGVDVDTLA